MRVFRSPVALCAAVLALASCTEQQLGTFDSPPNATINAPAPPDGADVVTWIDGPILLRGTVTDDRDDGEELIVRWESDQVGAPLHEGLADNQGTTQIERILLPGIHVVTLTVTDQSLNTGQDSVTIEVAGEPPEPPTVAINHPQASFLYYAAEAVHFEGQVAGPEGISNIMAVRWESSNESVPIFEGNSNSAGVTAFDRRLDPGMHTISLTATTSAGGTAIDTVTIEVTDYPIGQLDQDDDGYCPDGIDQDDDGRCEDGEVTGPGSQDCNDFNETVCPNCPEVCDGLDNDCDGNIDVGELDQDGDGQTPCQGDCNDLDARNFQGNPEVCDGVDNNCDGVANADPAGETDGDLDLYRTCDGDCSDNDPNINPGATEICNNVDDNCNGATDEGFDLDNDGYTTCAGDCNDANQSVNPGVLVDDCTNAIDDDCNGLINDDSAGPYEMWETTANSQGFQLPDAEPTIAFGNGSCSIGSFLELQPDTFSVNGIFSAPNDLYDIFEFESSLTGNVAAWIAFLTGGGNLPSGCTNGSLTWSAASPIMVTLDVDGDYYSGQGTSGSLNFNLSLTQIIGVDYEVIVQPMIAVSGCNYTYTLNFQIP